MLPNHLFVSSTDGGLWDTRIPHWSKAAPIRPAYCRTFGVITTTEQFKATLRNGAYAWPGGYPLYLVCDDGGALCFKCGKSELRQIVQSISTKARRDGWRVVGCDVNYEDEHCYCEHCGDHIAPAYPQD